MSKRDNMGTYTLTTGVYTITEQDGVNVIALKLLSGAANVSGSALIGAFGASTAISLVVNEPTNFSNEENIDGLVITVTSGSLLVITNQ